jgi:hypothetical protein
MSIRRHIQNIIGKSTNEISDGSQSNCFWATKYFFEPHSLPPQKLNGNEILKFIAEHFTQVEKPTTHDVFIIWNSSDVQLSPQKIDVHHLATFPKGFPFGLIIEHSGVYLENSNVFQKASPKQTDKFEVIKTDLAFLPYENLSWRQITYHRKKI